jgi:hypothetical protein
MKNVKMIKTLEARVSSVMNERLEEELDEYALQVVDSACFIYS